MAHLKVTLKLILFCLISAIPVMPAGAVPNTFSTGDPILASEVNGNFTDLDTRLDTNDSRLTSLEAPKTVTNYFSGYWSGFSALGSPKNVVVLESLYSDGSKLYSIRSQYHNSTETVSVNGSPIVAPLIAKYFWISVDATGVVTYIGGESEAPATTDYLDYTIEAFSYDITGTIKTIELAGDGLPDDRRSQDSEWLGGGSIGHLKVIETTTGIGQTDAFHALRAYTHLGAGTINGIQFPDLRGSNRMWSQGHEYRVYAKGIGMVFRIRYDTRANVVIYYQANGNTGGSLAGTPFAPGAVLDGKLF